MQACTAGQGVDFRKGNDGLAAVVQNELGLDPHSGIIVVFRAKRGDRIKVLLWDGSGLVPLMVCELTTAGQWMAYKRLEQGKFAWPTSWACKNMPCRSTGISDGVMRLEIDSSAIERTIRPIALNRKNALFAGHDEGGKNWGRIALLIETCKMNRVEPFAYFKATLEAIAAGHPANQIDELMPWAFNPTSS